MTRPFRSTGPDASVFGRPPPKPPRNHSSSGTTRAPSVGTVTGGALSVGTWGRAVGADRRAPGGADRETTRTLFGVRSPSKTQTLHVCHRCRETARAGARGVCLGRQSYGSPMECLGQMPPHIVESTVKMFHPERGDRPVHLSPRTKAPE